MLQANDRSIACIVPGVIGIGLALRAEDSPQRRAANARNVGATRAAAGRLGALIGVGAVGGGVRATAYVGRIVGEAIVAGLERQCFKWNAACAAIGSNRADAAELGKVQPHKTAGVLASSTCTGTHELRAEGEQRHQQYGEATCLQGKSTAISRT